jgi:hypothetical protein
MPKRFDEVLQRPHPCLCVIQQFATQSDHFKKGHGDRGCPFLVDLCVRAAMRDVRQQLELRANQCRLFDRVKSSSAVFCLQAVIDTGFLLLKGVDMQAGMSSSRAHGG